jgi:Spy/CpxP family protein refolding chaperone
MGYGGFELNKNEQPRTQFMKATKMTLIAALALGSMLTLGTALAADTNAPAATPPSGAPPGGAGGMRGGRGPNLDALADQLKLSEDQKSKVKTVLDDQRTKMGELRNEADQDARRTKMLSLREETNKKMKEILSADQYAQWEKTAVNMRGGNRGPRASGTNAPTGGGGTSGGTPPQN